MTTEFKVLSLGAGVQSSTLLMMMELGIVEKVDAAIFADTQAEPLKVYEWIDFLKTKTSIPIYITSYGNLEKDAIEIKTSKEGNKYQKTTIPVYTRNKKGGVGMLSRWCTEKYKVVPVQRQIRKLLKEKGLTTKNTKVILYIGISLDEKERQRVSKIKWIEHKYPLIEREITREHCLKWMQDNNFPLPNKSSCIFCPFHSDEQWMELKNNKEEWERIIVFEKQLQNSFKDTAKIVPYLHDSLMPIDEVNFKIGHDSSEEFSAECQGMCGV